MSSNLVKLYPPYVGNEPYIYYCFSPADSARAGELLKRLWLRGCRVWYCIGGTDDLKTEKHRHERMTGAGLVVLYVSENLQRDSVKRNAMFLQSNGTPIIAVDGEEVSNLSLGLREQTPHINAFEGISYDTEADLISNEVFSGSFIGPRPEAGLSTRRKVFLAAIISLAAAACIYFALSFTGVINGPVTVLTLKTLPVELSELSEYPALEKLIIPQSLITGADDDTVLRELAEKYTVVIDRGA